MSAIETAIRNENWRKARILIRAALRKQPQSHWLITRLSLTYYEEFDYKRSLLLSKKAYRLAPNCPLVLWDMAGSLDMLGKHSKAVSLYRRIIRRNLHALAVGDCGEGLAWARGLVADCWYRIANCEEKLGRKSNAINCYKKHTAMRGPGCRSIYPIKVVRKKIKELAA